MSRFHDVIPRLALAGAVLLLWSGGATAQAASSQSPLSGFILSGYATASYNSTVEEDFFASDFDVHVSPIILYNIGTDILFEAEFEFGLEDGQTATALEYAQIDYLGFEKVQLIAGKFLLPFGVFSERLHPSWINKLPSMPLLYGHAHGGVAEGVLTPVLSDVGLMARFCQPFGDGWSLDLSMYVTQGPRQASVEGEGEGEGDDHTHASVAARASAVPGHDDDPDAHASVIPGIAFGTNFGDNNDNKMLGARLGVVSGGSFELYVSGFHAMYNDADYLDLIGANLSAEVRSGGFELRGEGAILWQEFELEDEFPTARSPAYYLQASRRIGDFEPVVRWSHLMDAQVEGEVARDERRQVAFGLNYWLRPSVPVKLAFELNLDDSERLILQWAYGF